MRAVERCYKEARGACKHVHAPTPPGIAVRTACIKHASLYIINT